MKHIQPRVKGGRLPIGAAVEKRIEASVTFTADRFNVSRSWVIKVALAEFFGIDLERSQDYRERKTIRLAADRERRQA